MRELEDRLLTMYQYLNKQMDTMQKPSVIEMEDVKRKAYIDAYTRCATAIKNIVAGREFYDMGERF